VQELLANTVDLWWVELTKQVDVEAELGLLDDQECSRADRLRQPRHQERYILSHAELRRILAEYLGQPPESIVFCQGPQGKPFVLDRETERQASPLQFNLSHSGDAALIGVSQAPVGVDVEQIRPLTDSLSMAQRFFSEKEFIFLQSLHESERAIAFLKHWVCKEAYVKATGDGLVEQLHRVVVTLGDSASWNALPQRNLDNWQLQLLRPSDQTVAAVVVQQQSPLQIRWRRSPPS